MGIRKKNDPATLPATPEQKNAKPKKAAAKKPAGKTVSAPAKKRTVAKSRAESALEELQAVGGDFVPTVTIEADARSEEHTSELQSQSKIVCRLLLEKKKEHDENQREVFHLNTP